MKKKHKTGLVLRTQCSAAPPRGKAFLSALLPAALLSLGLAQTAASVFPSGVSNGWAAAAILFAFSPALLALAQTKAAPWMLAAGVLVLGAAASIFFAPLRDGFCALGNDILSVLPEKTGRIHMLWDVENTANARAAALFLAAATELLLCTGAVPSLIVAALFALGAAAGIVPAGWGAAAFLTGLVLWLLRGSGGERFSLSLVSAVLCAALAAAGVFALGGAPAAAQTDAALAWHAQRYDENTNSLPEGQLKDLGAWKKNDTPVLAVTMDTTQKLYLRGMTGEVYTGTAWEALPAAERAAWADDFYWLHADGFNALTSVSAAAELAAGTPAADMIVENLSACRERAYLPYALCAWEGLDDSLIGDASAPGTAEETLSYIPGSVPDWFTAQSALSVRQRGADVQAFLELEADYRAYAEANYLALPDEAAVAIGRALDLPAEKRTLSQIKDIILQTLESCLTYSESVVSYTGDTDFLTYALERSGSGYSVHYATAAALMLRYFGVPARYVEGYFLSAEEAGRYAAGERIVLTERNAHAWAEYYLDGVGWIPFETTPGYTDDEELNAGPGTGLKTERYYSQTEPEPPEDNTPEDITENGGMLRHFRVPSYVTAILLPLLVLLAAALFVLLRRRKLRAALQRIERLDNRGAIAALYGYAAALLRRTSLAPNELDGGTEAADLNREALFSAHAMTDAQRDAMKKYVRTTLDACRHRWSFGQKLVYRWIECLYL